MEVTYSADVEHIDEAIAEAARERPEKGIRIRVQPTIFRMVSGTSGGQHRAWPGVSWSLQCRGAEEAIALRDAMRTFFDAVARLGPGPVAHILRTTHTQ